jgi:methionyl-tRNA formyltransferase
VPELKVVYAADRDIGVWVLQYLLERKVYPKALLLSETGRATHANMLHEMCNYLADEAILVGKSFREPDALKFMQDLEPDYIVCIHFPYIIPKAVLDIPRYGVLNLHPAYLPYNRGWHTPSWAILEETPIGATLHFMDEGVDTGDIIHQKRLTPSPADTANSLYQKLKQLEIEVFKDAWPQIEDTTYSRTLQSQNSGTDHKRKDLFSKEIQQLQLDEILPVRTIFQKLRALTTNNIDEAAFFVEQGKRYRVQVNIVED